MARGMYHKGRSLSVELEAARQRMTRCLRHGGKEEGCYRARQEGCTGKSSLGIVGPTFEVGSKTVVLTWQTAR